MDQRIDDKTFRDIEHLRMAAGILAELRLAIARGDVGVFTIHEIGDAIRVGAILGEIGYEVQNWTHGSDIKMFVQPKETYRG